MDTFDDIDFSGVPTEVADWIKEQSLRKNPHRQEQRGRTSAEPSLYSNKISDSVTVDSVLQTAFDFREFQQLALYHQNGYYANIGDYQEAMPLLPQLLSPLFGMMMGELVIANYYSATPYRTPTPTVLSMGAGGGFLDHDLLEHIISDFFLNASQGYAEHARMLRDKATFLITDRSQYSLSLLKKELFDVLKNPRLRRRIQIEELDALDFNLGKKPFGIVYSNELIDCLPTEPIVSINGELYAVKVLPCNLSNTIENTDYSRKIESKLQIKGVISREEAKARIDALDIENIRFTPVFIPLSYDQTLSNHVEKLNSINRINEESFNGVYPIHFGIESMFQNILNSFDHGVIILIDYVSHMKGSHNWNITVNRFKHYEFGKEDVDFQIDPMQVIEKAHKKGMRCKDHSNLGSLLEQMAPLLNLKPNAPKRWAQAQGNPFSDHSIMAALFAYANLTEFAKKYDILTFYF